MGFPGSSDGQESAFSAGYLFYPWIREIPGSGGTPGEGNGDPLQYSCLENSTDRGDWWARVHSIPKSWM